MRFGFGELVVVFVIALLVIGPNKLPAAARSLGSVLRVFKDAMGEASKELQESVIEPLNEAQKPLREALAPVTEIKQEIDQEIDSFNSSMRNITNPTYKNPKLPETPQTGEAPEQLTEEVRQAVPAEDPVPETQKAVQEPEKGAAEPEEPAAE